MQRAARVKPAIQDILTDRFRLTDLFSELYYIAVEESPGKYARGRRFRSTALP
jgi:hypothetical protein